MFSNHQGITSLKLSQGPNREATKKFSRRVKKIGFLQSFFLGQSPASVRDSKDHINIGISALCSKVQYKGDTRTLGLKGPYVYIAYTIYYIPYTTQHILYILFAIYGVLMFVYHTILYHTIIYYTINNIYTMLYQMRMFRFLWSFGPCSHPACRLLSSTAMDRRLRGLRLTGPRANII